MFDSTTPTTSTPTSSFNFILLWITILCFCHHQITIVNGKVCKEEDLLKNDADIARLMSIGQFGRPFPESFTQIEEYCSETSKLNEKIDGYKAKCSIGSKKEFSSVIIYSIKKTLKHMCKKRGKRQESLLKSMICANKVATNTSVCYNQFIDKLQGIPKAQLTKQIPHACCEYIKLLECFEKSFHLVDNCQVRSEAFLEFVRNIFDDIVNLTCAEYTDNSDKCDRLSAPPIKDKTMKRTKSFLVPLMKVWESADKS